MTPTERVKETRLGMESKLTCISVVTTKISVNPVGSAAGRTPRGCSDLG